MDGHFHTAFHHGRPLGVRETMICLLQHTPWGNPSTQSCPSFLTCHGSRGTSRKPRMCLPAPAAFRLRPAALSPLPSPSGWAVHSRGPQLCLLLFTKSLHPSPAPCPMLGPLLLCKGAWSPGGGDGRDPKYLPLLSGSPMPLTPQSQGQLHQLEVLFYKPGIREGEPAARVTVTGSQGQRPRCRGACGASGPGLGGSSPELLTNPQAA